MIGSARFIVCQFEVRIEIAYIGLGWRDSRRVIGIRDSAGSATNRMKSRRWQSSLLSYRQARSFNEKGLVGAFDDDGAAGGGDEAVSASPGSRHGR